MLEKGRYKDEDTKTKLLGRDYIVDDRTCGNVLCEVP